jgi:proteic killer suppression protein
MLSIGYDPSRALQPVSSSRTESRGSVAWIWILARQRLAELNAAPSLSALSPLRSVGLHKLKGDRKGYWSISVSGPWRIVFRFENSNAFEVEIVDYH